MEVNYNSVASDSTSSPTGQKRQRARQACEPCRLRKRKCDGMLPCNMCTQFEYKCYFEKHPRKRSKIVEQNAIADGIEQLVKHEPPKEDRPSLEDMSKMRSMEANSGIAFTRLLGLRLDPSAGPKLFTFGWNLGSGSTYGLASSVLGRIPPITELLTKHQIDSLARYFWKNVHPLYGILDREYIEEQIELRWLQPELCKAPDHLLAGFATLASLFSDDSFAEVMPNVVESQKLWLENTSTMQPCSLVDVQSWLLRCLYLRGTEHPHAVHMASCIAIHLAESIGLHQEVSNSTLHTNPVDPTEDPEIRRRTFWMARMLNTWVSFEYGRTRVMLRAITIELPTPKEGDYTTDYIDLYSISCCLDPEVSDKAGQWEDFLRKLEAYEARHDGIALSKANLGLCGYRRLRLANPNISSESINRIINMGLRGLEAARRMAERELAWWHVANVPFQVVCVFLAMDVRESLSHIATAMRTLEFVVEKFHTIVMKEALKTARFLIRLSKKRKDEDAHVLGLSLKKGMDDGDPQPESLEPPLSSNGIPSVEPGEEATTHGSSEDWSMDLLNNSEFDWNFFLTYDMPAFVDFAPDGTL